MQIGFIGLGAMGGNIAANLQRAGHNLTVYDQRHAAAEPHLGRGALWADTPRQAAAQAEVVFATLPGPRKLN